MTKEENRAYINNRFIKELNEKGLNNADSFMIAYYDGPIVPKGHPNYNKYKVNLDIRKNDSLISGEIGLDGIEYNLTEATVDRLYNYVEKHIDKLKKLNDNQAPDEIAGGDGPLRIKYKLEMIYLKRSLASVIDKILIDAIRKDIVRIIKETSTKKEE